MEFDTDHSFFKINSKEYVINNISKVVYRDDRPKITLEKLPMRDLYFTKSAEWAYEREWRLLKSIDKAETRFDDGTISLFHIPKEIIKGIYLGAACSIELEERVTKSVAQNGLNCEIKKMVLNHSNYNIDTISIHEWMALKQEISGEVNILRAMEDIRNYLYGR